jgi:hypothetical protein
MVLDAYEPAARLFLAGWEGADGLGLERLCAADVSLVVARVPAAKRVGSAGPGLRAAVVVALLAPGGRDRSAAGVGGSGLAPGGPQPREAEGNLRRWVRAEREPQGGRVGRPREERRARHERDVVLERARQQPLGVPAVG